MSDVEGLNYVEAIGGDEHLPSALSRYQRPDDRTTVTALPLVQRKALRQMPLGKALLQHGSLPPAIIDTFQLDITRARRIRIRRRWGLPNQPGFPGWQHPACE